MKKEIALNHDVSLNTWQMEEVSGITAEYPYCMRVRDMSKEPMPWHWHTELEFNYVLEGSIRLWTGQDSYILQKGEACFTNSNVLTMKECAVPNEKTIEISHIFHPVLISGYYRSIYEMKYMMPVTKDQTIGVMIFKGDTPASRKLLNCLEQLTEIQDDPFSELLTRNLISEIWIYLMQEINDRKSKQLKVSTEGQDRLRFMMSYIQQHYMDKISLEAIADSAGVGTREALRCFQKNLGKTPFEYLNEYRLNQARHLLLSTDMTITQIALDTGFSDCSYFGKVFREYYRMTPGAYRKQENK